MIDWIYNSDSPSARQANPVDIDVTGLEGWLRWESGDSAVELGYAWLYKDEDYGDSSVDVRSLIVDPINVQSFLIEHGSIELVNDNFKLIASFFVL